MENLKFLEIFTDKDAEFNRYLVERGKLKEEQSKSSKYHRNRDYGSNILNEMKNKINKMKHKNE